MSEQKRALVVDDSKSARLVLRRMLEKHGLVVDTVKSADEALDFLTYNRPDAIFMDHMMPGMDGFEAVKAIKNNPETATIPVMMYTSKGGDLYLGQARALGAVGVLPKTVAPAELFESLCKIGLIGERRSQARSEPASHDDEEHASERVEDRLRRRPPAPEEAVIEPVMHNMHEEPDAIPNQARMRALLDEQSVEIRKDMLVSMETVARQTGSKMVRELDEKLDSLATPAAASSLSSGLTTLLLTLLLGSSLAWNYTLRKQHASAIPASAAATLNAGQSSSARDEALHALREHRDAGLAQLASSWQTTAWAMNQTLAYDYDAIALDGERIDLLENLLSRLHQAGFTGKLVLQTHVGEFCLQGSQGSGFHLPAAELAASECDFIGNPVQAADTPVTQQSLAFANFLASTPLLADGSIEMEIVSLPRDEPLAAYPAQDSATAAEWNRAAALNNRVLVQLEPR